MKIVAYTLVLGLLLSTDAGACEITHWKWEYTNTQRVVVEGVLENTQGRDSIAIQLYDANDNFLGLALGWVSGNVFSAQERVELKPQSLKLKYHCQ